MAAILIAVGLSARFGPWYSAEQKAVETVAAYFAAKGHRAELLTDQHSLPNRLRMDPPDLLVTDFIDVGDLNEVVAVLESNRPPHRIGLLVIAGVAAEVGTALGLSRQLSHLVDGFIIRPYFAGMSPEEMSRFRPYLSFMEQLIVSIGHFLNLAGHAAPGETG